MFAVYHLRSPCFPIRLTHESEKHALPSQSGHSASSNCPVPPQHIQRTCFLHPSCCFKHSPTACPSSLLSTRSSTTCPVHPYLENSARMLVELNFAVSPSPFLLTPPFLASSRTLIISVPAEWYRSIMALPHCFEPANSAAETFQFTSSATALHICTRASAIIQGSSLPSSFLLTNPSVATAKYPARTRFPFSSALRFVSMRAFTWPA
mmetsp:Transcript_63816/g.101133  ORF Transcript_63816/g.101133 Transcript_63816/m.101133 type:complete len:208 (+) Transcript_63816:201-824(+)